VLQELSERTLSEISSGSIVAFPEKGGKAILREEIRNKISRTFETEIEDRCRNF